VQQETAFFPHNPFLSSVSHNPLKSRLKPENYLFSKEKRLTIVISEEGKQRSATQSILVCSSKMDSHILQIAFALAAHISLNEGNIPNFLMDTSRVSC